MSGSLSAGLSLAQSVDTIVKEGADPISTEFRRVIVESRLGVPLEDSLEGVAERMESKDFEWVVMAIRIQRQVGGNLAELLLQVAATLREREYLRRQVLALSAEGRLSAWILGGLPPVFLLYLSVTKPDYVERALHHADRLGAARGHGGHARRRVRVDDEGREGEAVTTLVLAGGIGLIFLSLFLVLGAVGGLTKEATGVGRSLQVLEAMTSVARGACAPSRTRPSPTACCCRCWPAPRASADG